ncbi:type IV secretory system conjugative DNA transfer family protein [Bacteroides xylanisolvens]|uniref:YWFCY domain-containing protein n=1 Tax=Bacteroides xylanisolvens TaxID=371601 RepID=UPI001C39341E|nr:YWFCY domain-containing protein [Bacteroides xylanisolvens]MBV4223915.1 type IV secretory system conjugative DNA transfer family protein [Bacteroides xylanisolvens]
MEESKELQKMYTLFRGCIYVSIILEIIVFVPFPFLKGVQFIIDPMSRWLIYDNLIYSKLATVLLVLITCIGTRAQKAIEFDARRMVVYPMIGGIVITVLSVFSYNHILNFMVWKIPLNLVFYMLFSFIGVILINVSLDNLSKIIKHNLGRDKFNYENESFKQVDKKVENQYSVNIPTKYYHKGKLRDGWVNFTNPFRGTWVIGTPGSGKTFSIIEPFIRQHTSKGFAMVVYDYKFV